MPGITKEMLEKRAAMVRTGGKGSVRRTVKAHHKTTGDDKKVQTTLKKLGVGPITEIEEAYFIRQDGTGTVFKNAPRVQASMQSQCFAITGPFETKTAAEMMPMMLPDLVKAM